MSKLAFIGKLLFCFAVKGLVPKSQIQIQKTSQRKIDDRKLSQQPGKKKIKCNF
jgi:hypothetical protein